MSTGSRTRADTAAHGTRPDDAFPSVTLGFEDFDPLLGFREAATERLYFGA
ncbi:hypothetical protein ZOD2009_03632 [Haladaptatus paucihalophilus DX253]|uniref:Uncharacterized protein n=1 Tax=Haladaptatus paucihalophilus DX253 TaxID=797209 RepID=E7QPI8_HALPU|nr:MULTISPECIES: hypothetical protein [Haladaptatus]EFW93471.1 hypothetical protein ZOD2009_03632 [Haladaptatus paucihalophilus DX253]GKZ15876.1 hypothetical protein HAL_37570 [Haladaptatus sp. T7]